MDIGFDVVIRGGMDLEEIRGYHGKTYPTTGPTMDFA